MVYLDHWALVEFSKKDDYRQKFITALKTSSGTLLLSQANFFESAGFKDHEQALKIENLLNEAIPYVYVADTFKDRGFIFLNGGPEFEDSPKEHWLAKHMLDAAAVNNDQLTFSTMFTGVIDEYTMFAPIFEDMKSSVAAEVARFRADPALLEEGKKFIPNNNMSSQHLLMAALLRDIQVNSTQKFLSNDSMDFIHAVPALITSNFVLLDKAWCHRIDRAEKFLIGHGVARKFAKRYWDNPKKLEEFFEELSNFQASQSQNN